MIYTIMSQRQLLVVDDVVVVGKRVETRVR
jgi:hypothetical protein